MSSEDLLLKDFKPRSALVTEDNTPESARFPVVDAHNHLGYWDPYIFQDGAPPGWTVKDVPATVDLMDELNVKCVVNLDGGWGDQVKRNIERYKEPYPDRFCVFAWVDFSQIDETNFGEKWARELEKAVSAGVQGLKVFKTLGLEYRDNNGKLVVVDDPRIDPVWAMAGELDIPVLIHSSDPVAFFWPLDETNERWDELHDHPDWHFYGKDYPPFIVPLEAQLRVIARHPNTRFISAHVMSYAENLKYVAEALDKYPNLYVDIGERIGELGRQPYSTRRFMIEYSDRILFGTDIPPNRSTYEIYFRCLETEDEYFDYGRNQGRFRIYGVNLPDEILKKIYALNAMKVIPGMSDG
jgi:predicted TIM-barrel fold metal-dependent hydrolase